LKGIYAVIVYVKNDVSVNIGAIGKKTFSKGHYAYIGSSQNNLEKRVQRHLRRNKRLFWHIDYLLNNDNAKVAKVFYLQADKTKECEIANMLREQCEAITSFGCSDCYCTSHLFHLDSKNSFKIDFMKELKVEDF
jgi:Uri superfamily endonuclease